MPIRGGTRVSIRSRMSAQTRESLHTDPLSLTITSLAISCHVSTANFGLIRILCTSSKTNSDEHNRRAANVSLSRQKRDHKRQSRARRLTGKPHEPTAATTSSDMSCDVTSFPSALSNSTVSVRRRKICSWTSMSGHCPWMWRLQLGLKATDNRCNKENDNKVNSF